MWECWMRFGRTASTVLARLAMDSTRDHPMSEQPTQYLRFLLRYFLYGIDLDIPSATTSRMVARKGDVAGSYSLRCSRIHPPLRGVEDGADSADGSHGLR